MPCPLPCLWEPHFQPGGGMGGIDSHFLRSHFDPSFVYNSRLYTNLYACPDWPRYPRKLHLIPGSCRSSLHSGCFFLTRAIFIHSFINCL